MSRLDAVIEVLDKRAARGASDKSLISWLYHLKGTNRYFNHCLDLLIQAIEITPLNKGE